MQCNLLFSGMLALTLLDPAPVRADDVSQADGATLLPETASPARREWEIGLGLGLGYEPDYEGSDSFELQALPFIRLSYGRVTFTTNELEMNLLDRSAMRFGVSLGYGGGRDPADVDDGYLNGFEEIDDTAILGARFAFDLGPAEPYLEIERFLGESDGTSAIIGIAYEYQASRRLTFSADLSATISDENYIKTYFGVTEAQAVATDFSQYTADAGLRRVDLSLSATYALTERWFWIGELGVGQLTGDAADSPIVRDDLQPAISMLVGYRF